jgi:Glyoxalase-like domain
VTALRALDLDHAGLFVPDMDAAAAALQAMGFTLTPLTPQRTAPPCPGEPPAPAGMANRCIMLAGGYIEVLVAEEGADTPVARQLRAALDRHTGLHLIAFGTADALAERRRLDEAGYAPLPLVPLERPVATAEGGELARFSVVRVPPGTMAEGRIQFVRQHTPDLVWQPRFLGHRNRAAALAEVLLCVADPDEAAARYARFAGRPAAPIAPGHWRLATDRGRLTFMDPATLADALPGIEVPTLPFMAALTLASGDLAVTRAVLAAGGCAHRDPSPGVVRIEPPPALGATVLFGTADAASPWD